MTLTQFIDQEKEFWLKNEIRESGNPI